MQSDFIHAPLLGGPPPSNAYKRAVYRSAPANFDVEVLPPQKMGSSYAYGLRITPILTAVDLKAESVLEKRSSRSSRSSGSGSQWTSEYVIWRRWDDCLWFQDTLELEYSMQSREKRRRLAQGKGVKKNGVYNDSKMASSFESLPPGPDPNSIAKDIHDVLPKLTKKGTLFRASQATVDLRQRQFNDLICGFFQEDAPTLIRELRDNRNIRDFFGYWRRDKDFERKASEGKSPVSAGSTSSPWSLYFSPSTLTVNQPPVTPPDNMPSPALHHKEPPHTAHAAGFMRRDSGYAEGGSEPASSHRAPPQSAPANFARAPTFNPIFNPKRSTTSSGSSDESDAPSEMAAGGRQSRNSTLMAFPTSPTIQENSLYPDSVYDSSPDLDYPAPGLGALPENGELVMPLSKLDIPDQLPPPVRRARGASVSDKRNRNCLMFNDAAPESPASSRLTVQTDHSEDFPDSPDMLTPRTNSNTTFSSRLSSMFSISSSRRSSWQTSMSDLPVRPSSSQSQFYAPSCVEIDRSDSPILPLTPWQGDGETTFPRHYSISSINSVMTDTSVDRILPRSSKASKASVRRSFSAGSRKHNPYNQSMTVPEEECWSEQDEDLLDSYLYGTDMQSTTSVNSGSSDETSNHERTSQYVPNPDRFPKPFQNRPPGQFHIPWTPASTLNSPTSPSDSVASGKTLAIKAVLAEDSIVVFRVSTGITFSEIRQKIFDKFVRQEGLPMSGAFFIGYVLPASRRLSTSTASSTMTGRARSKSVSSAVSGRTDAGGDVIYVDSEGDWQEAVRSCSGKLTLRIFEST